MTLTNTDHYCAAPEPGAALGPPDPPIPPTDTALSMPDDSEDRRDLFEPADSGDDFDIDSVIDTWSLPAPNTNVHRTETESPVVGYDRIEHRTPDGELIFVSYEQSN